MTNTIPIDFISAKQKLMGIVLDDTPSEKDKKWARDYLQWMMDRLDACDTDSQTSNTIPQSSNPGSAGCTERLNELMI